MVVHTPLKIDIASKKKKTNKPEDIKRKLYRLANAIKIPPAINQFKTVLEKSDEERVFALFKKYMVESKEDKIKRLESNDSRAGPKPIISKYGLKHLTSLILAKKIKLVLIAADVDPITVVCWLPALCDKMGISYAIVSKQNDLGLLARLKRTAAIGLETVRSEDETEFKKIMDICDGVFKNQFEKHAITYGGGKINMSAEEVEKGIKNI